MVVIVGMEETIRFSELEFRWAAAHEFGHLLGVGDAYGIKPSPISLFGGKFYTYLQGIDLEKLYMLFITISIRLGW